MKLMARVVRHLIFQRKHGLNVENLTSAQSFPPFGEVVLSLLFSHKTWGGVWVVTAISSLVHY